MHISITACLLLGLVIGAGPAHGASREQDISAALAGRLDPDRLVQLGSPPFLGIFEDRPADAGRGAAVLIHGMGGHPDWPEVIGPLRSALPGAGWVTLSVQMPVLAPEQPMADYGKTVARASRRIGSAVQYLRDRHYQPIILIGYGFGAAEAAWYLSRGRGTGVDACVAVGILAQAYLNPRLDVLDMMKQIELPLLDIYGARDLDEILDGAGDRRLAGRDRGADDFRQIRIEGADHYFTGHDQALLEAILTWLDEVLPAPDPAADFINLEGGLLP